MVNKYTYFRNDNTFWKIVKLLGRQGFDCWKQINITFEDGKQSKCDCLFWSNNK